MQRQQYTTLLPHKGPSKGKYAILTQVEHDKTASLQDTRTHVIRLKHMI